MLSRHILTLYFYPCSIKSTGLPPSKTSCSAKLTASQYKLTRSLPSETSCKKPTRVCDLRCSRLIKCSSHYRLRSEKPDAMSRRARDHRDFAIHAKTRLFTKNRTRSHLFSSTQTRLLVPIQSYLPTSTYHCRRLQYLTSTKRWRSLFILQSPPTSKRGSTLRRSKR